MSFHYIIIGGSLSRKIGRLGTGAEYCGSNDRVFLLLFEVFRLYFSVFSEKSPLIVIAKGAINRGNDRKGFASSIHHTMSRHTSV